MKSIIRQFLELKGYSKINPKAILFDMDGVLYDSMKNHTAAWFRLFSELGVECTREEFYLYEGQTGRKTIADIILRAFNREATDEEKKTLYGKKTEYFSALGGAPALTGAVDVLQWVIDAGMTPVLVTGSGQPSLLDKLDANFPGTFVRERMVTAHDVKIGKPHPEPYLMGLERAGVAPYEAIVIENAPLGVEAAVAAGIFTIAVNTGPLDEKVLYDAGARIVLSGMEELHKKLEEIIALINETSI